MYALFFCLLYRPRALRIAWVSALVAFFLPGFFPLVTYVGTTSRIFPSFCWDSTVISAVYPSRSRAGWSSISSSIGKNSWDPFWRRRTLIVQ